MVSSSTKLLKLVFSAIWSYSLYYDVQHQPRLGHEWYIYKLIMLTNINFVIVTIYSVLSAISACIPPLGFMKKYLDHSLVTTIFPCCIVTCALFWGLYTIEPELVMPAWIRELIPSWLNHVTHTLPVLYVLFELMAEKRAGVDAKGRLFVSFLIVLFYFKVIFAVRYYEGYWIYPLLGLLGPAHFALSFVAAIAGYFLLTQLANVLLKKVDLEEAIDKKQKRK